MARDSAFTRPMNRNSDFYEKYELLALKLGVDRLIRLLPLDAERLKVAYATDPVLNNVPLHLWDRAADRLLPHERGNVLAMYERVCVLKHVAITRVCGG